MREPSDSRLLSDMGDALSGKDDGKRFLQNVLRSGGKVKKGSRHLSGKNGKEPANEKPECLARAEIEIMSFLFPAPQKTIFFIV